MSTRFDKVLVANRGEIAVRVIRGAKQQGYRTVAVYSDADINAMHVRLADEAMRLGPAPAAESYLSVEAVIRAARESGAQAIHPGYGFLSERDDFAQAVQDAGLVFIGPNPSSIQAMGNKSASKRLMIDAGVPCVPGYQGEDQDDETLLARAKEIGLPVMVKAAAGGGGRGMRLVDEEKQLLESIRSARSEAQNAFGSGQLLLEKAVLDARHVEIQVFGDRHGDVVYLGERDCSIQRRNQKVVEEAPSPAVDESLRTKMGEAAVAAAKAVDYVGAGTVEFLLAADQSFYFLEMNTRLQVEHPVTELVYGVDLVDWQLRIAQGEHLPMSQESILQRRHGHAIEVRLCAEDPRQGYLPQTGPVLSWQMPTGEGLRVDTYLESGQAISPYYDSMQAKIIAWGPDREVARQRLSVALSGTRLFGVTSNRDYLRAAINHPAFASGDFNTSFVGRYFSAQSLGAAQPSQLHRALAAVAIFLDDAKRLRQQHGLAEEVMAWHSSHPSSVDVLLGWGDSEWDVELEAGTAGQFDIHLNDERIQLKAVYLKSGEFAYWIDGKRERACYCRDGIKLWLDAADSIESYEDRTYAPAKTSGAGSDGRVLAHSDGKIAAVHVKVGETVSKGQTLLVLEAMKMEFQIAAPVDGVVESVGVEAGAQVKGRQLLVGIKPDATE